MVSSTTTLKEKVLSYYLMMQNTADIKYAEMNAGRSEIEAESDSSRIKTFIFSLVKREPQKCLVSGAN